MSEPRPQRNSREQIFADRKYAVRFQSALYSYHRGDFSIALPEFEKLAERFVRTGEAANYVECAAYILRLLAEREEFARVQAFEAQIQACIDKAEKGGTEKVPAKLKSRFEYLRGICSVYQGGSHEVAINYFHNSIRMAMECEDRSTLAWPLYGAATVLYARKRYDDALKELEKLQTLLDCQPVPDLSSAALVLKALILRNMGQHNAALKVAWETFEALKQNPHLVLYLHTLATIGTILAARGERNEARVYLELAEKSLRRDEFPRIARIVDEAIIGLGQAPALSSEFDLRFDSGTGSLIESRRGEIQFEGQFVLRDLLKLFLKAPGKTIRKEELIRDVWGEVYRPETHDNKIYVNIKRLRQLIEAEDGSTEYILRGKQGYFLNPKTRVLLVDSSIETPSTAATKET